MNSITILKAQNDSLTYSTNPSVTPQLTKDEGGKKSWGWIPKTIPWTEDALSRMVKSESYIPSLLKDSHKVKSSVTSVHFFAIDFDKGITTFEDYKEKKVKHFPFSAFMHTTFSHQKEVKKVVVNKETREEEVTIIPPKDKFRVIVPFSRPLKLSEIELIKHSEAFLQLFSLNPDDIDMSCLDANRFFKQNPEAITFFHNPAKNGKMVFFNPDTLLGKALEKQKTAKKGTNEKKQTFGLNDYLTLADGTEKQVKLIKEKTQIFCPFCDPLDRQHPDKDNAFIDFNSAGTRYIYCSSESRTFWQESASVDVTKSKLFWNTTVGCPSMIGYEGIDDEGAYYVFKNDADFKNYCYQNNINPSVKDYLPRREIIFHPGLPSGLTDKYYNVFEESVYMKKDYSKLQKLALISVVEELKKGTPVIAEILLNIFGKEEYLKRFLNWNAYILQKRTKADTAWLITSEEQGVGKDLMFNRILQPLYGEKQSQLLNGKRIAKDFNKQDLNCFLRGYNEVFSSNDRAGNLSRKEWLKDAITSKRQTVELKGIDSFQANNFMNFIIFSNNESPVVLDKSDRRFNVVRNKLAKKVKDLSFYRGKEFLEEDIENELSRFAEIIFTLEFDRELVDETLDTEAKQAIIAQSGDTYDSFAEALKNRNAAYFLLDEVFADQGGIGGAIKEVEIGIQQHAAILAKHMKKIISFHFQGYSSYKQVLEKLKARGIQAVPVRINGETIKAYKLK